MKDFPAKWKDIHVEGAKIKDGPYGKYNSLAGFWRNQEMTDYADALIAIQINDSSGTKDIIDKARKREIPIFIYPQKNPEESYSF